MKIPRSITYVIIVTLVSWFALTWMASAARRNLPDQPGQGWIAADFNQALDWATAAVGLASALAGLLGIAASADYAREGRGPLVDSGIVGLLGGATLLGVGGTAAPIGLAVYVGVRASVGVAETLRSAPPGGAAGRSA